MNVCQKLGVDGDLATGQICLSNYRGYVDEVPMVGEAARKGTSVSGPLTQANLSTAPRDKFCKFVALRTHDGRGFVHQVLP